MALVEGIGDEIVHLFCALFIVWLIVLLWMPTEMPETPLLGGATILVQRQGEELILHNGGVILIQPLNEDSTTDTDPVITSIQTNSTLRNDNLQNNENSATSENNATETESTTQSNESSQSTNDAINELQACEDTIKIRLKYLDDSYRLVEGSLQGNIGVFKRRHFSNELSSNKIIRLIFQGKIMNDDEASLSSYGLHDNCVVHCLIHNSHSTPSAQQNPDSVDNDTAEHHHPHPMINALQNLIPAEYIIELLDHDLQIPRIYQNGLSFSISLFGLGVIIILIHSYNVLHNSLSQISVSTCMFIFFFIMLFILFNLFS